MSAIFSIQMHSNGFFHIFDDDGDDGDGDDDDGDDGDANKSSGCVASWPG